MLGVALEGWPILILLGAALWLAAADADWLVVALLAVLLVASAAWFFEPERRLGADPLAVYAPVSGIVETALSAPCPILGEPALHVCIRVDPFGGYAIRAPVEAVLRESPRHPPGGVADWLRTDEGVDVVLAVVRGSLLGAHPVRVAYGQRVGHGRRVGPRRLARRIELRLPSSARLEVRPGERVTSGVSVIAHLAPGTT